MTKQYDAEAMRYLSYALYPLVIGYAIYALLYESHRSWYSWILNSLVGAVYTFGFILMCPQVNPGLLVLLPACCTKLNRYSPVEPAMRQSLHFMHILTPLLPLEGSDIVKAHVRCRKRFGQNHSESLTI